MSNWMQMTGRRVLAVTVSLCAAVVATLPTFAQEAAPKADQVRKSALSGAKPTSPNAMVNLVNLLVKQGVLSDEQAQALIKEAEDEAYIARQASQTAASKADEASKAATAAATAASPPGTKRVTYVPEIVKRELREELKQEVMEKAKDEKWAAPNTLPEWTQRIRFYGDMRVRYEGDFYPKGNDNSGALYNWNAINTGPPVDFTAGTPPPLRDADQNRNRFRLRARLGMEADLFDGFTAGLRIATGDNNSPVSTNVTLGGGGGNFSKYPLWLDRGYLRYALPSQDFVALLGRFDNPFFAPTDLMWYNELGFDGAAVQAKYEITADMFAAPAMFSFLGDFLGAPPAPETSSLPTKAPPAVPPFSVTPFVVAGVFPLFNTALNFPNNGDATVNPSPNPGAPGANAASQDKYMFGGQAGVGTLFAKDVAFKFAAGYFAFTNVQGQPSDPCIVGTASDVCDTDVLRPSFAQYGNTYMLLRNIIPTVANAGGKINQFQYYGLASAFRIVELTGSLDLAQFNPVHIIVDGTYVRNVAFHRDDINQVSVNNNAGTTVPHTVGEFDGGNQGAMARLSVGHPELKHLWDWRAFVAYKHLESDAVMDAFTDPDFGLGGTNLKGYIVGFNLGLGSNVWTSVKWMSANAIAGAPFAVDVLQVDLNGKF